MNPAEVGFNNFAGAWAAAMERSCLQGGAALGVAWIVCRTFPKLKAGTRCWILRLSYIKLVLGLFTVTPIDVPVLRMSALAMQTTVDASAQISTRNRVEGVLQERGRNNLKATRSGAVTLHSAEVCLFGVWLLAVSLGTWRVFHSYRFAVHLRAGARPLVEPEVVNDCESFRKLFGLRRSPQVLLTDGQFTALAFGLFRPSVILGMELWKDLGISVEERRLILAHEIAHIARRDLLWNWLPIAARTLFMFHPLVWLAEREWGQIQEMACDDHVLKLVKPLTKDYRATLLKAAAHIKHSPQRQTVALSVVESYDALQRRLNSMKTIGVSSRRSGLLTASGLVVVGVLCLVPWRLTAAPRSGKVVLLDHSKCHSEKDLPGGHVYDQEMDDFADSATYALSEVDVPESGWLVDSITVYFESPPNEKMSPQGKSVPHSDGWLKVNKARLNIFSKTGNVPSINDDPSKGEVMTITQKALKDGVYAITVGGLKRKLASGKYWVGLTPIYNWKRNGQGYHVMTVDKRTGDEGVIRNTGGGQHFGPEDETGWKTISHIYGGASEDEEPAMKIEGSLIDSKVAAG